MAGGNEIMEPVTYPSNADHLDRCLETIRKGFDTVLSQLDRPAAAISFAIPAPTDYVSGVVGDLKNLPAFRGGVPLGKILEHHYQMPVYMNNDGDLYAYGEALGGFLPEVNRMMQEAGHPRRFRNLIGLTLGTGFGGGFASDGVLLRGDNSIASEVWILSSSISPSRNAEEEISIRAVVRNYHSSAGIRDSEELSPREIFEIASGTRKGDRESALSSFTALGRHLGDVIANLISLMDGLVVIGGGIAGAEKFFMPALMEELEREFDFRKHDPIPRLIQKVYNLNHASGRRALSCVEGKYLKVPGSGEKIYYDPQPKLGLGTSRIGTGRAISLGAYAYALHRLDH